MTAEVLCKPPAPAPRPTVLSAYSTGMDSPATIYCRHALSEVSYGSMRFLISDKPTQSTLDSFIRELHRHSVKVLVRVCEPTYTMQRVAQRGIDVIDWQFEDGCPPSPQIIDKWLQLVLETFNPVAGKNGGNSSPPTAAAAKLQVPDAPPAEPPKKKEPSIAIHCVAGLGRSAVLVAIALVEAGMSCDDAIAMIRKNRRGALNDKQVDFLLKAYKPKGQLRKLKKVHSAPFTRVEETSDKGRGLCRVM